MARVYLWINQRIKCESIRESSFHLRALSSYLALLVWRSNIRNASHPPTSYSRHNVLLKCPYLLIVYIPNTCWWRLNILWRMLLTLPPWPAISSYQPSVAWLWVRTSHQIFFSFFSKIAVLRIRIRSPVPCWPRIRDRFFLDPESRFPDPKPVVLSDNSLGRK